MTGSYGLTVAYEDLWVPWYSGAIHCTVLFGFVDGRKCFLIEPHSADGFFERGHLYGSADDVTRFAFFSKAAVEFMFKSGKRPQIVHCHDWHTALVPVLLFEVYQRHRDGNPSGLLHGPQLQPSGHRGRVGAVGHRPMQPRSLLRLCAAARRLQPVRVQSAQGRDRVLELRHDRVARARVGGLLLRPGMRPRAHPLSPPRQVRRRPQRRRLRDLEPGDRSLDPTALRTGLDRR